jgi:putative phosphoribosyl transferase
MARFRNRIEAGEQLARHVAPLASERPIVLALPRGGVPVAYPIAEALDAPLDVIVARKLGVPGHPELGMGAIAEGGTVYVDAAITAQLGIDDDEVAAVRAVEVAELVRRVRMYRADRPPLDVRGRTVLVVDDGLATGVTARAALRSVHERGAARIVFAAPVCAAATAAELRAEMDEVVCASQPSSMVAVGLWYEDFSQTSDEEVLSLLARARERANEHGRGVSRIVRAAAQREIRVDAGDVTLDGTLSHPAGPRGIVLFAHGSGSSRFSPRNRYVAGELQRAGLGTILLDLLSPAEEAMDERTRALRFDIGLLARRLVSATDWIAANLPELPIGYFGASTGAAAAILAAVERPDHVRAVVSRGGRPDLAGDALGLLRAPTLLLVGGADREVLRLNQAALAQMHQPRLLTIVPGATHLFEEPGALTQVAKFAQRWLIAHLRSPEQTWRHAGKV